MAKIFGLRQRMRERGLIGGLTRTPTERGIEEQFQEFREGGISVPVDHREMAQVREPGDIQRLQQGLIGLGPQGIEVARRIQGTQPRPRGGATKTLLAIRARDGLTGNPQIDDLKPEQARGMLEELQATERFTSFDPRGMEVREAGTRGQVLRGRPGARRGVAPVSEFEPIIRDLGKRYQAAQLPQAIPAIRSIDRAVANFDRTGSMPGVGRLKNMRLSQFLQTSQGRQINAAIQRLENLSIKLLSGAAVSAHEETRLKVASALRTANTAADYVKIYKELIRPGWENVIRNIRGGAPQQAISAFERRSGLNLRLKPLKRRRFNPQTGRIE